MPLSRRLVCVGLSYRTAPVALRETAYCTLPQLVESRQSNPNHAGIREIALLSTCNRQELYAVVDADAHGPLGDADCQEEMLLSLWSSACGVDVSMLRSHFYAYHGLETHDHLCRVAAGLDSLVLGEPQILGQVTDAFVDGVDAGAVGPLLSALFRSAMRAGKRAHGETAISSRPVSVSSVAIATAESELGPLKAHKAVVIAVGEMGVQALKALHGRHVTDVTIVNRTVEKAEAVARRFGYRAAALEELPTLLAEADLVLSATAAPRQIITRHAIEGAQVSRSDDPLLIVDVALPRDVDPQVREVRGVRLLDIDELNTTVDDALATRRREVPKVDTIIAEEAAAFHKSMRELIVEPVIADLRKRAEKIRQAELERTLRFIGDELDPATLKHIQHLSRALVNKLLHEPTVALKKQATNGHVTEYTSTVQDLFGLATDGEAQAR